MDGKPENGTAPDCAEIVTRVMAVREVLNFIFNHECASRCKLMIGGVGEHGHVLENDRLVITRAVPSLLYDLVDMVRIQNATGKYPYLTVSVNKGGIVID